MCWFSEGCNVVGLVAVAILGLCLGSFSTAVSYRIPHSISLAFSKSPEPGTGKGMLERSACPDCGHVLGVLSLIPVFSWLFSSGRCRFCKEKISIYYPLTEILVMLLCIGVYISRGLSMESLVIIFTIPFLVSLATIDLKYMKLPNQLVLTCAILGIIFLFLQAFDSYLDTGLMPWSLIFDRLVAAILLFLIVLTLGFMVSRAKDRNSLGMGDTKLFAVFGLWLGMSSIPFMLLASGLFGVIHAIFCNIASRLAKDRKKDLAFPFGPSLIAAFYIAILSHGGSVHLFPCGVLPHIFH